MLGFPCLESIRCRLLAGLAILSANPSKPIVALTRSRRISRASCGSPLRNSVAASSSSALAKIWIAPHSFYDRIFEIARQPHLVYLLRPTDRTLALRLLYSIRSAFARSMSASCAAAEQDVCIAVSAK